MAQLSTDRGHLDHYTEAKDAWREEAGPSSASGRSRQRMLGESSF